MLNFLKCSNGFHKIISCEGAGALIGHAIFQLEILSLFDECDVKMHRITKSAS